MRPAPRRPLHEAAWAAVACVVVFVALHPLLVTGQHALGWDLARSSWPEIDFIARSLAAGQLPLWNPYEKLGYSFVGDPESAVLYPLRWALAALTGACGSQIWIALLQVLLHVGLAGGGTYLLLRRRGLPRASCLLAALTFVLCSRFAKSKDQTVLGTVAWLPWLLLALDQLLRRPTWRAGVALGLVVGLDFLAGYPPNWFRNLLALAIVFTVEGAHALRRATARAHYARRLAPALLAAAGVATLCALPVLVAVVSAYEGSARSTMSRTETLRSALSLVDALQLVAPGLRHGGSLPALYLGGLPVLLALLALTRYRPQRWLWAGLAGLFFLLACGDHTPLLPALYDALPLFRYWRIPEQYLFVTALLLCLLAAEGLGDLLAAATLGPGAAARLRWRLVALLALLVAAVGWRWLALGPASRGTHAFHTLPHAGGALGLALLPTLLGAAAALPLTWARGAHRRWALPPLFALLLLDLGTQLRPVYDLLEPWPRFEHEAALLQLPGIAQGDRFADDDYLTHRVSLRRSVYDALGTHRALTTDRYRDYWAAARTHAPMLAASAVRYYFGPAADRLATQREVPTRRLAPAVLELLAPAPLAYWHGSPVIVDDGATVLERLQRAAPPGVYFERGDLTAAERAAATARRSGGLQPAVVQERSRNRLRLAVEAPAAGVLLINEAYAPGWQATVDGRPARVLRANYLFRALLLAPGRHAIELSYAPRGLRPALAAFAALMVVLLAWGIGLGWRRCRSCAPHRPQGDLGGTER